MHEIGFNVVTLNLTLQTSVLVLIALCLFVAFYQWYSVFMRIQHSTDITRKVYFLSLTIIQWFNDLVMQLLELWKLTSFLLLGYVRLVQALGVIVKALWLLFCNVFVSFYFKQILKSCDMLQIIDSYSYLPCYNKEMKIINGIKILILNLKVMGLKV